MERTTKTRYTRRSEEKPEPPKPEWADLLETAITVEGTLSDTYRRLYDYSSTNCAYLALQGCPMEPIATFKRWQALGRQVLKGSSAYYILRPITVKTGEVDEETGQDKMIQRFKPVKSIFPVSMTEGEPLPEFEHPEWSKSRALGKLAIREVAFESFNSNTQGYSVGREFAVNPIAKHPDKTLMHELGHIVLGHTTSESLVEYQKHRGIFEFQAEGTAYLTMHELGLTDRMDASESRAYIQHYLRGQKPGDAQIRAVFRSTDEILKAGMPAGEEGDE